MRGAFLLLAGTLLAGCVDPGLGSVRLSTAITMPAGSPHQGLLHFFNLTGLEHVRYGFELRGGEGKASGCILAQGEVARWVEGARVDGEDCAYDTDAASRSEWVGKGAWAVAFRTESCQRPCELRAGHDAPSNSTMPFVVKAGR